MFIRIFILLLLFHRVAYTTITHEIEIPRLPSPPTPSLVKAVKTGYIEWIKVYVKKGYGVNVHDKHGRTPLMFASYDGRQDIITLLLENGASINYHNQQGENALLYAALGGHQHIVELLLKQGTSIDPLCYSSISTIQPSIILLLLKYNAFNVNSITRSISVYATPFMDVALTPNMPDFVFLRQLIKHGADVNITNNQGNTVLMLCMRDFLRHHSIYKTKCLMEFLFNHTPINPFIKNKEGKSALDFLKGLEKSHINNDLAQCLESYMEKYAYNRRLIAYLIRRRAPLNKKLVVCSTPRRTITPVHQLAPHLQEINTSAREHIAQPTPSVILKALSKCLFCVIQ